MDILDLFDKISSWLRSAHRHRAESTDAYLELIESACLALLRIEPGITDTSRLLQEKVRALYADAGVVLTPKLASPDVAVVMHALASARIYYWIRVLDLDSDSTFGSPEELRNLISRRSGRPLSEGFASLRPVERALRAMCPEQAGAPVGDEESLEHLRAACLRDFAALQALRARLRAR
jgi:hypothetical protein